MKKIFFLIFCILLLFICSACEDGEKAETRADVIINLPKDASVNGYRDKSTNAFDDTVIAENSVVVDTEVSQKITQSSNSKGEYCANINSKVFHKADCKSVNKMKAENRKYYKDKNELVSQGYKPCSICKP